MVFSIIVSRVSYLIIGIYLGLLNQNKSDRIEKLCKYLLILFSSINVVIRIVFIVLEDQYWMINGSSNQSEVLFSIIFSTASAMMISISVILTYSEVKKVMHNSLGKKINENLRMLAILLLFIVVCYWGFNILCRFCFIGNVKIK